LGTALFGRVLQSVFWNTLLLPIVTFRSIATSVLVRRRRLAAKRFGAKHGVAVKLWRLGARTCALDARHPVDPWRLDVYLPYVRGADARNHLLWSLLALNLDRGAGGRTAILGERVVSYADLTAATVAGASEIDDLFAAGSRVLVASRNQLHVAVGLLAALASRAVPLLVDPTSAERLRRTAEEWSVAGGIGERAVLDATALPVLDATRIAAWLDAARSPLSDFAPRAVSEAEPAFWTFTSGATGEPKTVVHAHRGPTAAYAAFARGVLRLGPDDVTIATAGLPFVYALGNNFFFPLMAGATAVLPGDLLLPTVLGELARHGASVLVAGPWSLDAIARLVVRSHHVEALRRLRLVLSAGEPLPELVFREWERRFGKEVLDNFGCTEMFNSFVSNTPGRARAGSLGFAVSGFEVRVGGERAARGARGALAVRGESRAIAVGTNGGLAAPEGEWCETGDEVEVDAHGGFVFLGRSDDRFKVHGQFVRPVEIERCLAGVEGVRECLVVPERDASGLPVVVARIVAAEAVASDELIRRVLGRARERLPSFAVPERVELVASLPRSARGKLERRPPR
jgi:acyl-coenzyme A synthetase/AMP-(fatty) acid ligase